VLVTDGPMIAAIWQGTILLEAARGLVAPQRSVQHRYPGAGIFTIVVEPKVPVPSDPVRRGLTDLIRAGAGLRCGFVVTEGSGFQQSLVRSVVAGLTLAVRPPFPMKVFSTVAEAASWAGKQGSPPGGAAVERDVAACIDAARARLRRTGTS